MRKYPELGVRGSALNQRFVTAVTERRRTSPAFFNDPRWALLLADELAPKPAASTPPPGATSEPTPAPVASSTPVAPPAPTTDYDAGTLSKTTGLVSAKFRWWSPPATPVRGVIVVLAGRGGDSRNMVSQKEWQALATQTHFALMGAQLVNPPDNLYQFQEDEGGVISDLLNRAVNAMLAQAGLKLKDPPLAFWGHSAGGNLTQQYMSRHANRVVGAVLLRATAGPGGLTPGKDAVPTLICVGGKDKPEWVQDALANYEKGHKLRANWTLALNPREGHEAGKTQGLAIAYLLAAINTRLPPTAASAFASDSASPVALLRLNKQAAWLGDPTTYEVAVYDKFTGKKQDAVWLEDEVTAKAWQAYMRGP